MTLRRLSLPGTAHDRSAVGDKESVFSALFLLGTMRKSRGDDATLTLYQQIFGSLPAKRARHAHQPGGLSPGRAVPPARATWFQATRLRESLSLAQRFEAKRSWVVSSGLARIARAKGHYGLAASLLGAASAC